MEFLGLLERIILRIPLWQLGAFLFVLTVFIFSRKTGLALLISYIFGLYWIFLNQARFMQKGSETIFFIIFFSFLGILLTLILIGFFYRSK